LKPFFAVPGEASAVVTVELMGTCLVGSRDTWT
jgi:hypothetical protein